MRCRSLPCLTAKTRGAELTFRRVERSFDRVVWIGRCRMVAPEPSHHFRKNRSAHTLTVSVHAPRVVQVIAFFGERVLQPHVLKEPVATRVVRSAASRAAVVVAPVLQEDAQRFLF